MDNQDPKHYTADVSEHVSIGESIDTETAAAIAAALQVDFWKDPQKALADASRASRLPIDTFQYTEAEMGQLVDVLEQPVRPPDVPAALATILSSLVLFGASLRDFWKSAASTPMTLDGWKLSSAFLGFALCTIIIWRTIAQQRSYKNDPHRRRAIDTARRMESYQKSLSAKA